MKIEQNSYEEPRCKVIEIQSVNVITTSFNYSNDFLGEHNLDSNS